VYIVLAIQTQAVLAYDAGVAVDLRRMTDGSIGVCAVFSNKRAAKKFAGQKYGIVEGEVDTINIKDGK
jgi:hypothetical protein